MTLESHLQTAGFRQQDETIWKKEVPWFYVQIEVQPSHYVVTLGHKESETIGQVEVKPATFDLNTYELQGPEYDAPEVFALHCLSDAIGYADEKAELLREKGTLIRTIFQDTLGYVARKYPEVPAHIREPAVLTMLARVLTEQDLPHYLAPATIVEGELQRRALEEFFQQYGTPEKSS